MTHALFSVGSLAAAVAIVFIVAWAVLELESRRNRRMCNELELMVRRLKDQREVSSLVAHHKGSLRDAG